MQVLFAELSTIDGVLVSRLLRLCTELGDVGDLQIVLRRISALILSIVVTN